MSRQLKNIFASIFVILAVMTTQIPASANSKLKAADFSLKDQNGKVHDFKFPNERVTILAFGDKDGSEQLEGWIRPLYEKYQDQIDIHGVAELSSVPAIARGIVRSIIRKKTTYSVMLDWEGKVSENYKYEKKKANIVIIDKKGTVVVREIGAADATRLEAIYKEIDKLLK
jgi:hypothetical protein